MTSLYLICVRDGIIWLNFCAFAKPRALSGTNLSRLELILSRYFLAVKQSETARSIIWMMNNYFSPAGTTAMSY